MLAPETRPTAREVAPARCPRLGAARSPSGTHQVCSQPVSMRTCPSTGSTAGHSGAPTSPVMRRRASRPTLVRPRHRRPKRSRSRTPRRSPASEAAHLHPSSEECLRRFLPIPATSDTWPAASRSRCHRSGMARRCAAPGDTRCDSPGTPASESRRRSGERRSERCRAWRLCAIVSHETKRSRAGRAAEKFET